MEFGSLWEVLAVLVFLLAPVWRSVMETRRRAVEDQRKRAAMPKSQEQAAAEEAASDLDPWEALLRGMEPPREEIDVEPEPEYEPDFDESPELPVTVPPEEPEPLVDFPGSSSSFQDPVQEGVGGLADALEHREEFHSSLEGRHLTGTGLSSLTPSLGVPPGYGVAGSAHARAGAHLPLPGQSADWRTAIVLAEILGPPTALRPGGYREPH